MQVQRVFQVSLASLLGLGLPLGSAGVAEAPTTVFPHENELRLVLLDLHRRQVDAFGLFSGAQRQRVVRRGPSLLSPRGVGQGHHHLAHHGRVHLPERSLLLIPEL